MVKISVSFFFLKENGEVNVSAFGFPTICDKIIF